MSRTATRTASRPLPAAAETVTLLAAGVLCVLASTVPLGSGGTLVLPDLLYCLLVAWVVRRPARTPLWLVVGLGLFADLMLSRPVGLGALGLMLAVETFRRQALLFHGAPFVLEWIAAAIGFALMLAGMHLALEIVFAHPPGLIASLHHLGSTAAAYPLVVLGLVWCLRVRAPQAVSDYRMGRLP